MVTIGVKFVPGEAADVMVARLRSALDPLVAAGALSYGQIVHISPDSRIPARRAMFTVSVPDSATAGVAMIALRGLANVEAIGLSAERARTP